MTCRTIPVDPAGEWESKIDIIAGERGYKNRDVINITREGLGDLYESKLKMFFEVHQLYACKVKDG
jgi:1,2-dihydroxy-3-keto-5-methylthiopentene dioxygenase